MGYSHLRYCNLTCSLVFTLKVSFPKFTLKVSLATDSDTDAFAVQVMNDATVKLTYYDAIFNTSSKLTSNSSAYVC